MSTRMILIIGLAVAVVVGMYFMGKVMDGGESDGQGGK